MAIIWLIYGYYMLNIWLLQIVDDVQGRPVHLMSKCPLNILVIFSDVQGRSEKQIPETNVLFW